MLPPPFDAPLPLSIAIAAASAAIANFKATRMSRLDKPLSEVLAEWEVSMKEDGITDCKSHQWLMANVNTGTVADFDAWIAQDHTEGPAICFQVIRDSFRHSASAEDAYDVQRASAQTLSQYPFDVGRGAAETALVTPIRDGDWDPTAKQTLIDYMLKNHPDPKAWFDRDHIRPLVPEVDVAAL